MNKILSVFFLISIFTLLAMACFGFEWAGGGGVTETLPSQIEAISGQAMIERNGEIRVLENGDALLRGEIIKTGDNSRAVVRIGRRTTICLDERTDISLERLFPYLIEIKIIRGRLWSQASNEIEKFTISSLETSKTITNDAITAVRYDWLEKTEIVLFENFDWENSDKKEFYEWAKDYDRRKLQFMED